jgi:hypothetical protein
MEDMSHYSEVQLGHGLNTVDAGPFPKAAKLRRRGPAHPIGAGPQRRHASETRLSAIESRKMGAQADSAREIMLRRTPRTGRNMLFYDTQPPLHAHAHHF